MSMRINISFVFATVFLLIVSFGLVSSQETSEEVDVGALLGLEDLEIVGEGIEFEQFEDGLNRVTFSGENPNLRIGENVFENIVPAGEDGEAFIDLNSEGEIVGAFFTVGEGGGSYNLGGVDFFSESESIVDYTSEENKISLENSKINSIDEKVSLIGNNVEFLEGHILNEGNLNFDGEGRIFVLGGNNAKVNEVNVFMPNNLDDESVNLFFGEEIQEGNSLSFGENKLIYSGEEGLSNPEIKFEKDNPYVEIEEGDYVSFEGDSFSIENRDNEDLIPKVIFEKESNFKLENDGKSMSIQGGKIMVDRSTRTFVEEGESPAKTTTSPLEINFEGDSNEKILFDNFNRFAIVPEGFDTDRYWDEFEGIFVGFSSNLKYNYVEEDNLQKIIGSEIDFGEGLEEIPEGEKQLALGRIRDYWETLSPETKEGVAKITISDDAFEGFAENEIAYEKEGKLFFRSLESSINFETFRHESAHAWHTSIKQTPEINSLISQVDGLVDELETAPSEQAKEEIEGRIRDLENKIVSRRLSGDPFTNNWKGTAGLYNKAVNVKGVGSFYKDSITETEYIVDESPRYGYIKPYGGTHPNEDIATFFEEIRNPEFFKPLLSEENEWHEIYRAKLDLIYEYGGITEREYFDILEAAQE